MEVAKRSTTKVAKHATAQRSRYCSALEPVLEHCEAPMPVPSTAGKTPPQQCFSSSAAAQSTKRLGAGKPARILVKLRDGYVKLMNDMASGAADLAGASSFMAAAPKVCDWPSRMVREKTAVEEQQILQALHLQQSPPQFLQRHGHGHGIVA